MLRTEERIRIRSLFSSAIAIIKTSTTLDERLNNDLFLLRIVFAIRDEERMVLFATVQRAPAMVKKANYAGNVVKM
jgi:hypothetical protein